jgi:hypothetical protein
MRSRAAAIVALALGVLVASPVAARPDAVFQLLSKTQQQPVEQQTPGGATQPDHSLWVTNPTSCLWDTDDALSARFIGSWVRGETHTYTDCIVTDDIAHRISLELGPGLVGSVTVDGVDVGLCSLSREWDSSEVTGLPEIAGSNGGHGQIVSVTWTVTNPGHPIKEGANIRIGPSWVGC